MAEIKDMPLRCLRLSIGYPLPVLRSFPLEEKRTWVEVPLDNNFFAEFFDRIGNIDSPVYADDISARTS